MSSISLTFRPTERMEKMTQTLIRSDFRVAKGRSQAIGYAFHDISADIEAGGRLDWESLIWRAKSGGLGSGGKKAPWTVTVDEADWDNVRSSFAEALGVERVHTDFIIGLVVFAAYEKLGAVEVPMPVVDLDGVDLLRAVNDKAAELIKVGDIQAIKRFLGEED